MNILMMALLTLLISWKMGILDGVYAHQQDQAARQHAAEVLAAQKHAALLQQYVGCAAVTAYNEGANQGKGGMIAIVSALKNRANAWFKGDICKAAANHHKGPNGKSYADFSWLMKEARLRGDHLSFQARQTALAAADAVIVRGVTDPTQGATYYLSQPGCESDSQYKSLESCVKNFIRRNHLDADSVKRFKDHLFFQKAHKGSRMAMVPLPLARPGREFVEDVPQSTALDTLFAVTNAAFGTSFGANRTRVAENTQ